MSAKAIRKALAPLYRKTRIAHFAVRVFFFFCARLREIGLQIIYGNF